MACAGASLACDALEAGQPTHAPERNKAAYSVETSPHLRAQGTRVLSTVSCIDCDDHLPQLGNRIRPVIAGGAAFGWDDISSAQVKTSTWQPTLKYSSADAATDAATGNVDADADEDADVDALFDEDDAEEEFKESFFAISSGF